MVPELHHLLVRARANVAEPLVAVVFLVVVCRRRKLVRGSVQSTATLLATASANEAARLPATAKQLAECAASTGLNVEHATDSSARFARQ